MCIRDRVAGALGTLFGKAAENVIVTPEHFMLVAIVGGVLLVAAVLVSSISTMRLKPKQILSQMEMCIRDRRVAIARAISTKPAIILADELTGNLDHKTSDNVVGLLKVTSHEFHQTILMITHDSDLAKMADRMIHMEDGKLLPDLRPCKVTKLKC